MDLSASGTNGKPQCRYNCCQDHSLCYCLLELGSFKEMRDRESLGSREAIAHLDTAKSVH